MSSESTFEVVHRGSVTAVKVTVVLPTYNRAALLAGAVSSILEQDVAGLELIVVDDGSTDGTARMLEELASRDVRVTVIRQKNQRLPKALNRGFSFARGEFLTWTSDDNRYRPGALSFMCKALEEDTSLGLVYAGMFYRRSGALVPREVRNPEDLWEYNKFGAAFMYRRDVASRIEGYDPDLFMCEDYDFLLRLSYEAPVRFLPERIYEYLDHEESLTRRAALAQAEAMERMIDKHRALGRASRLQLGTLMTSISGNVRRAGMVGPAMRFAGRSLRLCPWNWKAYKSVGLALAARLVSRGTAVGGTSG